MTIFRMLARVVAALALALPAMAHAEWYEASSAHFLVYSNQAPDKLEAFATKLEKFDKAMRVLRNLPDPPVGPANRLTVYVVDDVADVRRLAGGAAAGFYKPRANGSVAFVPRSAGNGRSQDLDPDEILFHEYAHHFMWYMAPNAAYPMWFVEGWAEFHATALFNKEGAVGFGAPPQYRARALMDGNSLPIDKLLFATARDLSDSERPALYGRGWLLTHYLTFGETRKGQLKAYVDALGAGKSPAEAAQVFGDLRQLDKELGRYKLGKFQPVGIVAAALPIGKVVMRKLTPGEAAVMPIFLVSRNGVDDKTGPELLERMQKAAAPFAGDARVQTMLAETAFWAGAYDVAEQAADRAIAIDGTIARAWGYKAWTQLVRTTKAGNKDRATWAAIRKTIATANRLDTEDPVPLMLFFRSYINAGEVPSPNARAGMFKAFALAPFDSGLRMDVARIHLNQGEIDAARSLVRPLVYQPHNQRLADAAAAMLAEMDRRSAAQH